MLGSFRREGSYFLSIVKFILFKIKLSVYDPDVSNITWPTMHTINFILLHAYFIFCTNYLLENRIELCIVIHDRCMYRKNGMKFEFPKKIYQLYHFLDETWQINYCKNGICLFLLFFIITIVGSILQGYLFKERWTTVRPHLYKCYNL